MKTDLTTEPQRNTEASPEYCPRCQGPLRHDCGPYYFCIPCQKLWEKLKAINLSPRESECCCCGAQIIGGNKGIPLYEGDPVAHDWAGDWAGFDACEQCFGEYERMQAHPARLQLWWDSKRKGK